MASTKILKNEFGLMERCELCQGADMTFETVDEQDSDDQYDWEKIKEKRWKETERTEVSWTETTS